MPRNARKKSSSGIYHIIMRGINRQSIFEDEEDRVKFLECLKKYKEIGKYQIFAYCLMDNHVHILLQEIEDSISVLMQRICSRYVFWYNSKYGRCGHLLQERFKSEPVEDESYFLTVIRYIHQNPLKASFVNDIADYKWSSYIEYRNQRNFVDTEYVLGILSDMREKAIKSFEQFHREETEDVCLEIATNKVKLSDEEFRILFKQQYGIDTIKIMQEDRERQDTLLRLMRAFEGSTIRQIARLTGMTATRVWQA